MPTLLVQMHVYAHTRSCAHTCEYTEPSEATSLAAGAISRMLVGSAAPAAFQLDQMPSGYKCPAPGVIYLPLPTSPSCLHCPAPNIHGHLPKAPTLGHPLSKADPPLATLPSMSCNLWLLLLVSSHCVPFPVHRVWPAGGE